MPFLFNDDKSKLGPNELGFISNVTVAPVVKRVGVLSDVTLYQGWPKTVFFPLSQDANFSENIVGISRFWCANNFSQDVIPEVKALGTFSDIKPVTSSGVTHYGIDIVLVNYGQEQIVLKKQTTDLYYLEYLKLYTR